MSRARRGWFPDHWDPNVLREWDGQRWTGRTMSLVSPDEPPAPLDTIQPPGRDDEDDVDDTSVARILDRISARAQRRHADAVDQQVA